MNVCPGRDLAWLHSEGNNASSDSHQACKLAKSLTRWSTPSSTVPSPWTELSQTPQGVLVSSRGHLVKGDEVHLHIFTYWKPLLCSSKGVFLFSLTQNQRTFPGHMLQMKLRCGLAHTCWFDSSGCCMTRRHNMSLDGASSDEHQCQHDILQSPG